MKKRHILICSIVGLLLIAACGDKEEMEMGSTVTETENNLVYETMESEFETETEENKGESTDEQERIPAEQSNTLEEFLKTALLPVGNTMYIWGGGWNEEDTGAGPGAMTLGVHPEWAGFAALQDETYNYKEHKYEILKGLDCSGYVGWVVYNQFEEEYGNTGYVYKSTETAAKFSEFGWGQLVEMPEEFLPGDIVSMKGHVWICLGMCEDGSVVLLHASPPGVSVCGTKVDGGAKSQAAELAKQYMTMYYPVWQEKYPDREVGQKYVTDVTLMRWNSDTFEDAETLQKMSAEEVLKLLFAE